uniref:Uncharacterized protein n=1 Tax=Anguilla anguilla TaxID=7936 RepID=A0A0E9VCN3_ANGAN
MHTAKPLQQIHGSGMAMCIPQSS